MQTLCIFSLFKRIVNESILIKHFEISNAGKTRGLIHSGVKLSLEAWANNNIWKSMSYIYSCIKHKILAENCGKCMKFEYGIWNLCVHYTQCMTSVCVFYLCIGITGPKNISNLPFLAHSRNTVKNSSCPNQQSCISANLG